MLGFSRIFADILDFRFRHESFLEVARYALNIRWHNCVYSKCTRSDILIPLADHILKSFFFNLVLRGLEYSFVAGQCDPYQTYRFRPGSNNARYCVLLRVIQEIALNI